MSEKLLIRLLRATARAVLRELDEHEREQAQGAQPAVAQTPPPAVRPDKVKRAVDATLRKMRQFG